MLNKKFLPELCARNSDGPMFWLDNKYSASKPHIPLHQRQRTGRVSERGQSQTTRLFVVCSLFVRGLPTIVTPLFPRSYVLPPYPHQFSGGLHPRDTLHERGANGERQHLAELAPLKGKQLAILHCLKGHRARRRSRLAHDEQGCKSGGKGGYVLQYIDTSLGCETTMTLLS